MAETALYLAVLAFAGYKVWPQVGAALNVGAPGGLAPSFAATTLQGEPVSIESLRGQVVLVNFWATWCPPCRVEMPGFERVYQDKRDRGFVIVALSTDQGSTARVEDFLTQRGITFPVALASAETKHAFGGVRALPTSFLIDREGRVRHTVYGIFAEPALRLAVNRLLDEAPASAEREGPPAVE